MRRWITALGLVVFALAAIALHRPAQAQEEAAPKRAGRPIVVASKPFPESMLLGEMFAQVLEREGYAVQRKLAMGQTAVLHEALAVGAVDCYPEYTGTGFMAVLKKPSQTDPGTVFDTVAREYAANWGMLWCPSLGFQNTYAMAVRREVAEAHQLRTLSDLATVGSHITAAFSTSFQERPDGLPGLAKTYGLQLKSADAMDVALKYRAVEHGSVDLIDAYSTDGEIARFDLVVLHDDKQFFPPYDCCPLVSKRLAAEFPGAVLALMRELSGRIDESTMQQWNAAISVDKTPIKTMATEALAALRSGAGTNAVRSQGLFAFAWANRGRLLSDTARHVWLVLAALVAACAFAIPLGVWLERVRGAAEHVVRGAGVLQTIPSLALLALMIPILRRIGFWPAVIALFLYSLYPIVRATYTGVRDAGGDAVEAARAIGMTPGQVLRHVRLPLAAPFIMSGVRTAAVITVGTATLAAYVGAGGLGAPIMEGLSMLDNRLILLGAIPAALLALVVDGLLALVERAVRPKTAS